MKLFKQTSPPTRWFPKYEEFLEEAGRRGADFISVSPVPLVYREGPQVRIEIVLSLYAKAHWNDHSIASEAIWMQNYESPTWAEQDDLRGLFREGPLGKVYKRWLEHLERDARFHCPNAVLVVHNIEQVVSLNR